MRPLMQMGQSASSALQSMPQDKREAAAKSIDADIRKFADEGVPLLRDRAIKLAPATVGPILEQKMSEDELKQLITWLDSTAAKKYQQVGGEIQQAMAQKLSTEAGPLLLTKLQALDLKVRATLGVTEPAAASASMPPAKASAPAKKASGK
jgi:hypothetical protein